MEDKIKLSVVAADRAVLDKNVAYVNIPTDSGAVGIWADHAPLMCAVSEGRMKCHFSDGSEIFLQLGGGIASAADNKVNILVSRAEITE
ncbi:MAG: F0F1 ATP synthase subunit epsilon [Candidatus Limivicinus sp.]|jgi:F-type H+-transporting ATPase subunit epsilon